MRDRILHTQGRSIGVVYVKSHIRKGKVVKAYTRGNYSKDRTSPSADKNLYGKVQNLLTSDGSLIRTTGKHRESSFRADVLFDARSGVSEFDRNFYKGKGIYKKFRGNVDSYVKKKSEERRLIKGAETAQRHSINQEIAHYFEKNKRKYTR